MALGEQELVVRARKGDKRAFSALVERYQRRVFSLAVGVLHDPEEAMDVSQEVFIRVFRSLDKFEGTSSFGTWLYRVTMNLSIDHIRSRKRRQEESFEASSDNLHVLETMSEENRTVSKVSFNPVDVVSEQELKIKLDECLSKLPDIHRQVLVLRELEGLSYSDIAKVLDISKGTVMSRLHHARDKLKALLAEQMRFGRGDKTGQVVLTGNGNEELTNAAEDMT
ncbi:MAG: sigma-70 family RNA polymerase sigma factor [Deltaproteobacteria bacterium]|nr:sigma-70 family RNA polymerase sigma factor [Deltaproteobacteria bacterium]